MARYRIANRPRRLRRRSASSALTITSSKKASTGPRSPARVCNEPRVIAGVELRDRPGARPDAPSRTGSFRRARAGAPRSHAASAWSAFFRMLPIRLLAAASARRLGQGREGAHRGQPLDHVAQALRPQRQHGVDFLGAVALLAQRAGQALVDEIRQQAGRLGIGAVERAPPPRRSSSSRASGRSFSISIRTMPRAWRRSAKGSLSPVGSWPMENSPGQRFQLVGQRRRQADPVARQAVAGKARLVVILDRVRDLVAQAVVQRVITAHDALAVRGTRPPCR